MEVKNDKKDFREMRILLIGEYSNVHWTLAEGLRTLGHVVCVASNGDYWKNYQRDVSLVRKSVGAIDSIRYFLQVESALHKMKGYDIVQIINPMFFDLRSDRIRPMYKFLRKHNSRVFMAAYGMDYYWINTCRTTHTFRYSDFNIGNRLRTDNAAMENIADWIDTDKGKLNQEIANDCDGIVAGLYEYYACYNPIFPEKTKYIPFPVNTDAIHPVYNPNADKLRFFIGVQKSRSQYKGTDIMLKAVEKVVAEYGDKSELLKAESVPYHIYQNMMNSSHVLLDQLYSYTPAMNGLLAMAKGLVLVGGGEPECYDLLGEHEIQPIVNVLPDEKDVYDKLCKLISDKEGVVQKARDSRLFVERHHDYRKVAKEYIDFWSKF